MELNARPVPVPDPISQFYWDAAKSGVLAIQSFPEIGHLQHPPGPVPEVPGGAAGTPSPAVGPCAASSRLSTLCVAVVGKSAAIRTYLGHAFGDRSGWLARNFSNPSGVIVAPLFSTTAAMIWSPTCSSGTAYTATRL